MNIQVLFNIMSERAAYHAAVAERVPCKFWANATDMQTTMAANGNAADPAQKLADLFKHNRNEMLYDYTPVTAVSADADMVEKPESVMTYLFTASTRAMVAMPTCQSFVSNAALGSKPAASAADYWYEDSMAEEVLEDVTPNNVIQFVPRRTANQRRWK